METNFEQVEINGIKYVRADALAASSLLPPQQPANPLAVGNSVLIRGVTHYYTGRIVDITDTQVVLIDAAWIADTGRFNVALLNGQLSEVEPYPDPVSIARGCICDVTTWRHALPRVQK